MPSDSPRLRRVRSCLTCLAVAANAICAGGIFTFPLMSPALAQHLKLTQPQLTTIVLAGMVGQYPFAAVVGKVIDRYGPWACSLVASLLFSSAFGLFSLEISKTPDDISQPSLSSFERLTILFFIGGLGTVFSYFSALFAASKNFPDYIGLASGATMALFGLSPLFLSFLASAFFTTPETGLDVSHYLTCLAILAGVVNFFGALTMGTPQTLAQKAQEDADTEQPDEHTQLLPGKVSTATGDVVPVEEDGTVLDLLKDVHFGALIAVALLVCGVCEMIMSNMGTIVLSLPSYSRSQSQIPGIQEVGTDSATSTQVRLLSLSNTISRLVVGPLADFVSPVASYLPNGNRQFLRKHHISRVAFLALASILLAATFLATELRVRTQQDLWILSVGTGITYGTTFTVLPSIISSIWGLKNMARNFGIVSYAPFVGTPLFSYLYAFVAADHAPNGGVCEGVTCWELTFWVSAGAALVALGVSSFLWRRWKGKL